MLVKDKTTNDENIWKEETTNKIITELKKKKIQISPNTIQLLFNEHCENSTTNIFRKIKDSDEERNLLAEVLIGSKKLVSPPNNLPYHVQDIDAILKTADSFDLSKINSILPKSIRSLDYLKSYLEFLYNNGINPGISASIKLVIEQEDREEIEFDRKIINLCYKIGKEIFQNEHSLSPEFRDGFARASITIKFHNELSLKRIACNISDTYEATTVIKAYLEKSRESDRRQLVLLRELISDVDLITSIFNERDTNDFIFLKAQLSEGNWYDSSSAYLKDFFDQNTEKICQQIGKLENFTILKQIVKETFKKVRISTIEKAIDAQIFGAYIIMFGARKGHLADCVDKLSIRNLEKGISPERKWDFRSDYQRDSIEDDYGVKPKYDFINFSDSSRIGIFQKEISFSKLQSNFLEDLKIIIKNWPPESNGRET